MSVLLALTVFVCSLVFITSLASTAIMFLLYKRSLAVVHVPGPPVRNRLVGHVPFMAEFVSKRQYREQYLYECHLEYGPVVLIWLYIFPLVFICDSSAARMFLNDSSHPKPRWPYTLLRSVCGARFLGEGLVTTTDQESRERRHQAISPGFRRRYLKNLVGTFNDTTNKFIDTLLRMGQNGASVPMRKMFPAFTLEVIATVAFDEQLDSIHNKDHVLRESFVKVTDAIFQIMKDPVGCLCNWSFLKMSRKHCKKLRQAGTEIVRKRLDLNSSQGTDKRNDILDFILAAAESDRSLSMNDLVDEFVTFFFAGHDTTAIILSFMLENVLRHPDVKEKTLDEVNKVLSNRDDVEYEDLNQLDYIGCVFKEALRLYPPASGTARVISKNTTICGYPISQGTNISISFYCIQRSPSYWHDPLQFNPDRFHEGESNNLQAFMPFSVGNRSCLGRQFAEMEVKILFAKIFKRVKFELFPDKETGLIGEGLLLVPASDINCTLHELQ